MAIDPYKPELAKRKAAFQIADKQLTVALNQVRQNPTKNLREKLTKALEAMRDYKQTGESLSEWVEQHQDKTSGELP